MNKFRYFTCPWLGANRDIIFVVVNDLISTGNYVENTIQLEEYSNGFRKNHHSLQWWLNNPHLKYKEITYKIAFKILNEKLISKHGYDWISNNLKGFPKTYVPKWKSVNWE